MRELERDGWRGAEAVYVWSFYSQGTDEKRQGSADEFFSDALAWFGYDGDLAAFRSQQAKGAALADLVRSQRALLILDGLEPLQYGPARRSDGRSTAGMTGGLKDAGLNTLLRALAADQPGLTLVTTRLALPDLADVPAPALLREALIHVPLLPDEAADDPARREAIRDARTALSEADYRAIPAVALLEHLSVNGTGRELWQLADELNGHALALNLFGKFLAKFHNGDVHRRDLLPGGHEMQETLSDFSLDKERDPFRVMRSCEIQSERQGAAPNIKDHHRAGAKL